MELSVMPPQRPVRGESDEPERYRASRPPSLTNGANDVHELARKYPARNQTDVPLPHVTKSRKLAGHGVGGPVCRIRIAAVILSNERPQ